MQLPPYVPYFSLLLVILLGIACDKETPEPIDKLPPVTMEGANTFACLLNGEYWTNTPMFLNDNIAVHYGERSHNFFIQASRIIDGSSQNRKDDYLDITAQFETEGIHKLSGGSYQDLLFSCEQPERFIEISVPSAEENFVQISRLDTEQNIISGTFQFTVIDTICQDTFRFTEGRFDYRYTN